MESVLTAAISLFVLIYGVLTLSYVSLDAQDNMQEAWREMEERLDEQTRTHLTLVDVQVDASGSAVRVTLRNDGDIKLLDYERWDAIFHYYDDSAEYYVDWLPYEESASVSSNQWTVVGIYLDAESNIPEAYERGIFNPGEEIVLQLNPSPAVGIDTTNLLIISTDNGARSTVMFSN